MHVRLIPCGPKYEHALELLVYDFCHINDVELTLSFFDAENCNIVPIVVLITKSSS